MTCTSNFKIFKYYGSQCLLVLWNLLGLKGWKKSHFFTNGMFLSVKHGCFECDSYRFFPSSIVTETSLLDRNAFTNNGKKPILGNL